MSACFGCGRQMILTFFGGDIVALGFLVATSRLLINVCHQDHASLHRVICIRKIRHREALILPLLRQTVLEPEDHGGHIGGNMDFIFSYFQNFLLLDFLASLVVLDLFELEGFLYLGSIPLRSFEQRVFDLCVYNFLPLF